MYEMKVNGDITKLLRSISEITQSVDSIPKSGSNPDYSFVMEKDVVNALRGQLAEKNILLIPNVVDSTERVVQTGNVTTTITKVVMSFTLFDIQTAASITTYFHGEGEDALDKGIYKAITGCQK